MGLQRDADDWANWFWNDFFKDWLADVQDDQNGVFDTLDVNGNADLSADKSLLAQARTLFTICHVALLSQDPALVSAAQTQAVFLDRFRKANGLYRCTAKRDGNPTGQPADEIARSYDQSFVILALVTWNQVSPTAETTLLIEECWAAIQLHLIDVETGLLRNDEADANTMPAQNPHMHLYEACLQAFRMTDDAIWLERAAALRAQGVRYFMDQDSGSIAEFLTPDLKPLPGADGLRREVGHQCEWSWLLLEEAELAKSPALKVPATRLFDFAIRHGFSDDGPLTGAAFDAVSTDGDVTENSFLLWPQTEAIKILAVQHTAGDANSGDHARTLACLMFEKWFYDRPTFVNQLDAAGNVLWPQALTRVMYHVVLAMTEGAKAGLWTGPVRHELS